MKIYRFIEKGRFSEQKPIIWYYVGHHTYIGLLALILKIFNYIIKHYQVQLTEDFVMQEFNDDEAIY